jgi:hypothetical protein
MIEGSGSGSVSVPLTNCGAEPDPGGGKHEAGADGHGPASCCCQQGKRGQNPRHHRQSYQVGFQGETPFMTGRKGGGGYYLGWDIWEAKGGKLILFVSPQIRQLGSFRKFLGSFRKFLGSFRKFLGSFCNRKSANLQGKKQCF